MDPIEESVESASAVSRRAFFAWLATAGAGLLMAPARAAAARVRRARPRPPGDGGVAKEVSETRKGLEAIRKFELPAAAEPAFVFRAFRVGAMSGKE